MTLRRSLFAWLLMAGVLAPSAARSAPPADFSLSDVARSTAKTIAIESAKDSFKTKARCWLRAKVVCDKDLGCYGLILDPTWQDADSDKPVVVLLHGFNSTPARNEAMLQTVRSAGYPCGAFAYPNDYEIPASAQMLSSELRRFAADYPDRRVILVCHSMGGMVARACVEDSLYDPGNVDRLILIAPPNNGSMIARFAVGTDIWEHWLARRDGGPWRRLRDSITDGLGEAADELCPDSVFLRNLNSRSRNPRIQYTVILGSGANMTEAEMTWIRESVVAKIATVPGAERSAARFDALLAEMDELVEGKGDGVVAIERGRLTGVSDTLVLPFGHLSVTGDPSTVVVRQVQAAVLERLATDR